MVTNCFSQEIIIPKGYWYFGAEVGTNSILSNEFQNSTDFQFGVSSEYYFAKQWSLFSKIKFYKTQVAYSHQPNILSNGAKPYNTLLFDGNIISVPLNIKWEFRIVKNFKGYLTTGFAYNVETKSNYEIPNNPNPDVSMFPTNYLSSNSELGFEYFLNKYPQYNSLY